MNNIPANAIITSAKLRFKHISKGTIQHNPNGIYEKNIYVNATMGDRSGDSGAYFGESPYRDSSQLTCSDYDDDGRLQYIAKVDDPLPSATSDEDYINAAPWAEAELYGMTHFPYFYDGEDINAKGMFALTYLFRQVVENQTVIDNCLAADHPAKSFLNDKTTCLAWTQFKLQTIQDPEAKQNAVYEAGALGPLLDQYWEDAPELVLTWKLPGDITSEELTAYNTIKSAFDGQTPSQSDALLSGNATCIASPTEENCALPAGFPE